MVSVRIFFNCEIKMKAVCVFVKLLNKIRVLIKSKNTYYVRMYVYRRNHTYNIIFTYIIQNTGNKL